MIFNQLISNILELIRLKHLGNIFTTPGVGEFIVVQINNEQEIIPGQLNMVNENRILEGCQHFNKNMSRI